MAHTHTNEGPLPKLRSGEKQGDILSTQSTPEAFKLVGEKYCPNLAADEAKAAADEAARLEAERRNQFRFSFFNEGDCGGVFDGNGVISDADGGL